MKYQIVRSPFSLSWAGPSFMPMSFNTQFDYNDTWVDTTALGFVDYAYRANSLYDPDTAVGGNVPLGFGQMSNIYKTYLVTSCDVRLEVVNASADPLFAALTFDQVSTAYSSSNQEAILGYPYSKHAIVKKENGRTTVIVNNLDLRKLFGVTDLDSIGFQSLYNTNPSIIGFLHISLYNKAGTTLSATVNLKMRYHATLSELRNSDFAV